MSTHGALDSHLVSFFLFSKSHSMSSLESDVASLFTSLRFLTQENSYRETLDRVLDMQQQLAELTAARKADSREIHQAEVKTQRLEKEVEIQKERITSLSTSLQGSQSELAAVRAQLDNEKGESQEAFKTVTAELEAKTKKLEQLQRYTSELRPASSSRVAPAFTKLFHQAFSLARKYVGKEVENIADNPLWGTFGGHPAVDDNKIPLPLNNSKAAQQMRTAAFIVILSTALMDCVFHPSYALYEEESSEFLVRIASKNSALEAHLRSVLLKAQPETQRKTEGERRARLAAAVVMEHLEGMFGEQDEKRLGSELEVLCNRASSVWQEVQTLDRMFTAVLTVDGIPNPRDWKILDFGEKPQQEASSKDQSDSNSSTRGDKTKGPAGPDSVVERVIWPSLVMAGLTDEMAVAGFALSDRQVSAARAEKNKSPHRDTRFKQRNSFSASQAGGSRFGGPLRFGNGRT
ncbi:hypothetical protein B0T14DRAFT_517723 [Immersiella caudata]|uniref:Uncharacterized protein n=1 Tax=Immersiella caudata TaxID=314043 RepID=A0AA39WZ08_9PEZI|nr:hypothetical protein B0T14DRAFT_517723 [Immersiella caudata]